LSYHFPHRQIDCTVYKAAITWTVLHSMADNHQKFTITHFFKLVIMACIVVQAVV